MPGIFLSQMVWDDCAEEDVLPFLDSVRSDQFPALFSGGHHKLYRTELDFYDGYALYALANTSMLPFYEMYFLSNGENHQYLDGTIFPFQALINLDAVSLTPQNVEAYLAFYFYFVFDPSKKIRVIIDPNNTPYAGPSAMAHHFKAIKHHDKRDIAYDEQTQRYTIQAPILYDSETVSGVVSVSSSGVIHVLQPESVTLLDNSVDDAAPSFIHPHEGQLIEENVETLKLSAEGQRLLQMQRDHGVKLRIVAGIPHCGFALNSREIFVVAPAYQNVGSGYQSIDFAIALRECEHVLCKLSRPSPDGDEEEYIHQNYEANLDCALTLCKIADECEQKGHTEFLHCLRKSGYEQLYSGYKNGLDVMELYELYLDMACKEFEESE